MTDALSSNRYNFFMMKLNSKTIVDIFRWMNFMQSSTSILKLPLDGKNLGLYLGRIWSNIRYYIHYIILIILLLYDILFNHLVLANIFFVLPFVFIYDLWIKLCKFINGLNNFYDMYIHYMLYDKLYILDDKYVQVGPFTVEHSTIRKVYMYYILTDLVHDREAENNEDLSPEEILKNKKITWFEIFNLYYKKFKAKIKEIFYDPILLIILLYYNRILRYKTIKYLDILITYEKQLYLCLSLVYLAFIIYQLIKLTTDLKDIPIKILPRIRRY